MDNQSQIDGTDANEKSNLLSTTVFIKMEEEDQDESNLLSNLPSTSDLTREEIKCEPEPDPLETNKSHTKATLESGPTFVVKQEKIVDEPIELLTQNSGKHIRIEMITDIVGKNKVESDSFATLPVFDLEYCKLSETPEKYNQIKCAKDDIKQFERHEYREEEHLKIENTNFTMKQLPKQTYGRGNKHKKVQKEVRIVMTPNISIQPEEIVENTNELVTQNSNKHLKIETMSDIEKSENEAKTLAVFPKFEIDFDKISEDSKSCNESKSVYDNIDQLAKKKYGRKKTIRKYQEYAKYMNLYLTGNFHSCKECDIEYKAKQQLIQHIEAFHLGIKHSCTECEQTFTQKKSLTRHFNSVHLKKKVECNLCTKTFSGQKSLKKHIDSFHFGKLYPCTECEKKFANKDYLVEHIDAIHRGQLISCEECGKTFINRGGLKRHFDSMHLGKVYTCAECDKTFKDKRNLKRHKCGSGYKEKLHACTECDKRFTTKGNLKTHIDSVHLGKLYACTECDKKFDRNTLLMRHMNTTHPAKLDEPQ